MVNMLRNLSKCVSISGGSTLSRRCLSTSAALSNKIINPAVAENRWHSQQEGFVWKSGYEPIVVPELTLDDYVWKNVAKWENKIAIVISRMKIRKPKIHTIKFLINFLGMWHNWSEV